MPCTGGPVIKADNVPVNGNGEWSALWSLAVLVGLWATRAQTLPLALIEA